MRLTTQHRAEVSTIQREVYRIEDEFSKPMTMELNNFHGLSLASEEIIPRLNEELHTYKVRLENILCETDIKNEKLQILKGLIHIEYIICQFQNNLDKLMLHDDQERYFKMAMRIDPSDPQLSESYGAHLMQKQFSNHTAEKDYSYIEYLRTGLERNSDNSTYEIKLRQIKFHESHRDYHSPSVKQINHLIQIDEKPNLDFMEPRWELYKISISFEDQTIMDACKLQGTKHRVFFQNAEGNINMGVLFNDPDVDYGDICWYNELAGAMQESLEDNDGLITVDEELKTRSCYVELHSHPVGSNGRNNIVVVTPMKFLPVTEFEKRQKSVDQNKMRAIMSSMITKTSEVIENKKKAIKLKEQGNDAFKRKKFEVAEKFYSDALQLNLDSRPIWTNRAVCRNSMKNHEDALADCLAALSIDPKNTKTITQKGNALLSLGEFDKAKECYESLRELGENSDADKNFKKLNEVQFPKPPTKTCKKKKQRK